MAMLRKIGAWAAAGVVTLVLGAPAARADDDTYRLGGKAGDGDTRTLSWDGEENGTTLTRGYRGGVGHYGYGHYHGGYGGYRHVGYYGGGYRHVGYYGGGYRYGGYYGGYRSVGYYGGYYRPYVGYYGGGYYAPYVYTTPVYYYSSPAYYYSAPCYTYPISVTVGGATVAETYRPTYQYQPQYQPQQQPPQLYQQPMPGAPNNGTYPYDGGPVAPVPLPRDPTQTPSVQPGLKVVIPAQGDGRLVSLPAQPQTGSSGFAYQAYGEQQPSGFASDRALTGTAAQKRK